MGTDEAMERSKEIKMNRVLRRILLMLLASVNWKESAFWTGTVNAVLQVVLRYVPEELGGQVATQLADLMLTLFPYAFGRLVSWLAKGESHPSVEAAGLK